MQNKPKKIPKSKCKYGCGTKLRTPGEISAGFCWYCFAKLWGPRFEKQLNVINLL